MARVSVDVKIDANAVYGAVRSPEAQRNFDQLAEAALAMQRVLVPVDTGRLSRSLGIRKTPDGIGREIGSFSVEYAAYVEDGHQTRAGTWVPAQPYIRPSIDAIRKRLG